MAPTVVWTICKSCQQTMQHPCIAHLSLKEKCSFSVICSVLLHAYIHCPYFCFWIQTIIYGNRFVLYKKHNFWIKCLKTTVIRAEQFFIYLKRLLCNKESNILQSNTYYYLFPHLLSAFDCWFDILGFRLFQKPCWFNGLNVRLKTQ